MPTQSPPITLEVALAITAELWQFEAQHLSESALVDVCAKHRAAISRDRANGLVTSLPRFKERDCKDALTCTLQAHCTDDSQKRPLDVINEAMLQVDDMRVFASKQDLDDMLRRHVRMLKVAPTKLTQEIAGHVLSPEGEKRMIVVGGPSGGGKTVALMSQSAGKATAVAYLRATNESEISDASLKKRVGKQQQTDAVANYLVEELLQAVPARALTAMEMLKEESEVLRFLVAIDEMGSFPLAVRAMCRLRGNRLKAKLESKSGRKFPKVIFVLAAAGTGIGHRDDFSAEGFRNSIGSDDADFKYYTAPDRSDEGNWQIFYSYLSEVGEKALRESLPSVFLAAVLENARMAAILGSQVSSALRALEQKSHTKVLCTLDMQTFLGPAFFEFKGLNSLTTLSVDGLWESLVKAVRMHFFPYAPTVDAGAFEINYGLVTSRALSIGDGYKPAPGWSPIGLPFFSVALLASLCGNRAMTQSITSGVALEEYALATLFMIACAACDEELFLLALEYKNGDLMPLWNVGLGPEGEERKCADGSFSTKMFLPPSTASTLHPLLHDMSRVAEPEPAKKSVPEKNVKGEKSVQRRYLDEMTRVLRPFGRELRPTPTGRLSSVPVAAVRSPDKMPFGDIVLLIGRSAFIIEAKAKDMPLIKGIGPELWNMGFPCQAPPGTKPEHVGRPREILKGILEAWLKSTKLAVTTVHMCFVTPTARSAKASRAAFEKVSVPDEKEQGKWTIEYSNTSASIDRHVRFLSVEDIEFIKYSPGRRRAMPYVFSELPVSSFTKGAPTPTLPNATEQQNSTTPELPTTPPVRIRGTKWRRDEVQ